MAVSVPYCKNKTLTEAIEKIEKAGLKYEIVGSSSPDAVVTKQSPAAYSRVEKSSGKVILYVGDSAATDMVEVPDLMGMNAVQANAKLMGAGLNVRIMGTANHMSGTGAKVYSQSHEAGTKVARGTVVTLYFRDLVSDDYVED